MSKPPTIGVLARESGVNLETIRFYERSGLLPEPQRSPSGYRHYQEQDVRRLRFIRRGILHLLRIIFSLIQFVINFRRIVAAKQGQAQGGSE